MTVGTRTILRFLIKDSFSNAMSYSCTNTEPNHEHGNDLYRLLEVIKLG